MSEVAKEVDVSPAEDNAQLEMDASLIDPLSDPLQTSSSLSGGAVTQDGMPESDALKDVEGWHKRMAMEVSTLLEKPQGGTTAQEVYERKLTFADRLAEAYTAQLEEGVGMTISVRPPERGSGDKALGYHVRIAPNDTDYHGCIQTELPDWVCRAIKFNRKKHTSTSGLLQMMLSVSGNQSLVMTAYAEMLLAEKGIGAGFVYLAADVQRKLNKIPKSVCPTPVKVDGMLGEGTTDRFAIFERWRKTPSMSRLEDLFSDIGDVDLERSDSGSGEDLERLPPDIAAAIQYNRGKHTFKKSLIADLYKISGDQNLAMNANKSGEIGVDFVYLVRAAQMEMNRRADEHGELRVKIDGKLGPDTVKRYSGEGDSDGYKKLKAQEDALIEAQKELGNVDGIHGFTSVTGGLLDTLLPREGDKRKLVVAGNALIPAIGGKLGLVFTAEGERGDNLKVRGELKGQFSASVDAWIVEAFVQAGVFGYLEVAANSGTAVMRLIFASIEEAVRAVSPDAASYVFGDGYFEEVRGDMDDDDYIEYGWGVEASAGLSIGKIDPTDKNENSGSVEGKVRRQSGTQLTRDKKTNNVQWEVAGKASVDGWGEGELKVVPKWVDDIFSEIDVGVTLKREVNLMDFSSQFSPAAVNEQMAYWIGNAVGLVQGVVKKQSGLNEKLGGRTLGEILQVASSQTYNLSENAVVAAAQNLQALATKNPSFKMGQSLEIKLNLNASGKCVLSFELANNTQFEIGEGERDAFYLSLEKTRRILYGEITF